jgi:hypothetical protein
VLVLVEPCSPPALSPLPHRTHKSVEISFPAPVAGRSAPETPLVMVSAGGYKQAGENTHVR